MNVAIILAGGTGTRLGSDIPKQYIKVGGKMIIEYCMNIFARAESIDAIQIVADAAWHDEIRKSYANASADGNVAKTGADSKLVGNGNLLGFSKPGANRQLSIYNALTDIEEFMSGGAVRDTENAAGSADDFVIIHDAARPNITCEMIDGYFDLVKGHDGLMPALPMKDTVYVSRNGSSIESLLDRSTIYAGQAPEIFLYEKYKKACEALIPDKIMNINGSTEVAILAGMDIMITPGDEKNYKITTKTDLAKFEASQK